MPSKFSSRLRRRVVLSGKDGIAGFYKGVGARVEGNHTSKGKYVMRPERCMRIVTPTSLTSSFQLKPYVHTAVAPPVRGARVPSWTEVDAANAQLR